MSLRILVPPPHVSEPSLQSIPYAYNYKSIIPSMIRTKSLRPHCPHRSSSVCSYEEVTQSALRLIPVAHILRQYSMKAKNQPKPSALRHKVEVSFAEAEVIGRISFQGPQTGPWKQHNARSEYPCRCNQR